MPVFPARSGSKRWLWSGYYVKREERGKGFGKQLFISVMRYASEVGLYMKVFPSDGHARTFFRRMSPRGQSPKVHIVG